MKIATFNVNGINGRLPILLEWLERAAPDVVCLQELKAPSERFPITAIENAGYGAIWKGQARWNGVAILAKGTEPVETRRELPGDPDDDQSRYLECAIKGVLVAGFYVPNGNPRPGPKFDYKLRWLERLAAHCAELWASGLPVVLAGDFNIIPAEQDVYKPERWREDALFAPEVRAEYQRLLQQGWTDSLRQIYPREKVYTFWHYFRSSFARDAGLRIDHILLSAPLAPKLKSAGVDKSVRATEHASDHAPVWFELDNS